MSSCAAEQVSGETAGIGGIAWGAYRGHTSPSYSSCWEVLVAKASNVVDAHSSGAVEEAARILREGGLVAFPTETVYGLGADACNPIAVARIFEVKGRPEFDPIILHAADPADAVRYGDVGGSVAQELIRRFWPGPLTLVVPRTDLVPPIVTAGLDTVGIRVPAHPSALALIRATERAIAAPSANPFGYVSPTEARHVADQLGDRVDLILDGGKCSIGIESTVLSLVDPVPRILRAGGTTAEEIAQVIGKVEYAAQTVSAPMSPGQLKRHYATRTPFEIIKSLEECPKPAPGEKAGLLTLTAPLAEVGYAAVEVLSKSGNLREAAANLFSALRRLDRMRLDRIVACRVPEEGLGVAIMDRLRRCAAGSTEPEQDHQTVR